MADQDLLKHRHFILDGFTATERFARPRQRITPTPIPLQNRQRHGAALLGQINNLRPVLDEVRAAHEDAGLEGGFGLHIEFESFPDIELAFERLARESSGIELLNVRHADTVTYATVFIPDGKLAHFEKVIVSYLDERLDTKSGAKNRLLVDTIRQIRVASVRALWTDDDVVFPANDDNVFWWEVWLPIGRDRSGTLDRFLKLAEAQQMRVAAGILEFPERTVLLVRTSAALLGRSMMTLNSIAELRRAKETAEFFDSLSPDAQPQWLDDLLGRSEFVGREDDVPYICLLDTGVNNGHPLIAPALADEDLHTVEPAWGSDDSEGHGTAMAGLAIAGNLTEVLASSDPIQVGHRLESVKLLQNDGGNEGDAQHFGYLTIEAVARPEVTDPDRKRVFAMAVTARDYRDLGRPSAWSAALDRLAADYDGANAAPRLLLVAAGNINDLNAWANYPSSNATDGIHDPAQAWNALTIGAYTDLTQIADASANAYESIAEAGGLSPFSTTSATWQARWPLKPDVVFEGGNAAKDTISAIGMSSLSLLTAHHQPTQRLFTTANATSAATALASRFAAQLMCAYPDLWPESIRALMVHSAEWTDAMKQMFLPRQGKPSKSNYVSLIRHCGFGVPDLDRAMWSVSNSLTMMLEAQLRPFQKAGSKQPTLRDMALHQLPWPLAELEALGSTLVTMRVTLSYFVEPNPSARGFRSRYRYESHGLRFDVKRAHESVEGFRSRINAAARDEEEGTLSGGDDPGWAIGIKARHKGSLHSDFWVGTAVDLASRGLIAVYPTLGWWKTRPALARYDSPARYALVVSIHAPEVEVDLYAAVAANIAVPVAVEIR